MSDTRETAYGFMPDTPCSWCNGRWPTRYQYEIQMHGPSASIFAYLCGVCWSRLVESREARQLMRHLEANFSGQQRRLDV